MSWPGCPLSRKARATPVHLDSWTKDPTGLQNWPCPARADGAHRFLAIGWVCSSHRRTFSADSSCARACLQPTARPFTEKKWHRGHDTGCKCRLSVQPYPKGNPMAELPSSPPVPVYYQYQKTKSLLLTIPRKVRSSPQHAPLQRRVAQRS